jgi:hypothetical protein
MYKKYHMVLEFVERLHIERSFMNRKIMIWVLVANL